MKPSASVGRIERRKADSTAESLRREAEDAANAKFRAELEAVLGDAIEALEHSDATLTFLQQSLGVRASPRLDQLRQAKSKLRNFLRTHRVEPSSPPAENGVDVVTVVE